MWSASITKSSRGPTCKTTKCFTRRKETRRVDVHRYKDLDSSSNDLSLFPSIIVFCLKSLITSSITGTEHNNAQTRITLWTVLTFPHPVAMFDLVYRLLKQNKIGGKKSIPIAKLVYVYVYTRIFYDLLRIPFIETKSHPTLEMLFFRSSFYIILKFKSKNLLEWKK